MADKEMRVDRPNIYAPGLNDSEMGLIRWALSYAHEVLRDAQADGEDPEGALTIGDRIDELEALNYKLNFLDPIDYGEPADG